MRSSAGKSVDIAGDEDRLKNEGARRCRERYRDLDSGVEKVCCGSAVPQDFFFIWSGATFGYQVMGIYDGTRLTRILSFAMCHIIMLRAY